MTPSQGLPVVAVLGGLLASPALGCGSDTADGSPGGAAATGGSATSAGGLGGSGGTGGQGGELLLTGGGAPTCTPEDEAATVTLDGVEVLGRVESLHVAPSPSLSICWTMPDDQIEFVLCSRFLTITFDEVAFGMPMDATATGTTAVPTEATYTSLPGFTVTLEDTAEPTLSGSFEGAVDDGAATHPISGTFTGCPLATE